MMQNLKKIANAVATFGPIGYLPFAGLITVLLSIPVVMVVNTLIFALPVLYPFLYVVLTVLCGAVLIFALHQSKSEDEGQRTEVLRTEVPPRNAMMINRLLGLLFVFSGIAVNMKLLVIGSLFFLLARHFIPQLLLRYAGINFASWPTLVHLLFIDVTAGLAVNFVFRFIFWLVAMPR